MIFIVSLTGRWIEKNFIDLNLDTNKTILLTYRYDFSNCFKTIKFEKIDFFFNSILTSSMSLQVFFVTLAPYCDSIIKVKQTKQRAVKGTNF